MLQNKILLLSLSYPPVLNAQAIRWKYFTNIWKKHGIDVDVINPFNDFRGKFLKYPFRFLLRRRMAFRSHSELNSTLDKVLRYLLYTYELLLLGDTFWDWNLFLKKRIGESELSTYSAIIVSSELHISTILPTLWLNHKKVIVDVADPPISNYFLGKPLFQKFHDFLFRKALQKANKIIVSSTMLRAFLSNKFDVPSNKIFTIYQGFPLLLAKSKQYVSSKGPIKLGYAGNFIKKIREPDALITGLKPFIKKIQFHYLGKKDYWTMKFKRELGSSFVFAGVLSHEKTLSYLSKMDVLVYLGNRTSYQMPGKFFEYLGLKKPILFIYQDENDEAMRISRSLEVPAIYSYNEAAGISKAIYRLLNSYPRLSKATCKDISRFSWEAQAEKYLDLLLM